MAKCGNCNGSGTETKIVKTVVKQKNCGNCGSTGKAPGK